MRRPLKQHSVVDQLLDDDRPVDVWVDHAMRLVPLVYVRDADLAPRLERLLRSLRGQAADLVCIGTDDPSAPPVGASTRDVLGYFFRERDAFTHEYRHTFARVDQLLGRQTLLAIMR
jgi:hypothetical protein